ncbi:MAG: outer membrane beta-barrel protein [Bacteroidetes bacterium]|nr:outer membrane beta-barrel protein [Bacteroidota bacterium]
MKSNSAFSLFILLFLLQPSNASAQTSLVFQGYAMPSILTSTEDFYFEYFGDNKTQPMIQYGGRVGIGIKSHWQVLLGFSFHKRKMSTDCLFIPRPGIDIINGTIPITGSSKCTHTVKRDYSIVEMPLLISYKLKSTNGFTPYFQIGFSPWKKIKTNQVKQQIDTGEVTKEKRSYSSGRIYFMYSNLSIGTSYSISKKMSLMCEATYRVDDKTFKDNTFGLAIGLGYEIGKAKRR